MSSDPIVRRIADGLGVPDLVARLAALPASDLTSLLLAVGRARATKVTPQALLAQAARRGMLAPSDVDARTFADLDLAAFDAAARHGFEAIELAPVAPSGVDACFGGISPNNVLATVRPVQLMADPTTSLALLAALRRRADRARPVRLVASHRVMRLQPIEPGRDFTPHFKLLALATAGRDAGAHGFETTALREHLAVHLDLLAALAPLGYRFDPIEVSVSDTAVVRALVEAAGGDAAAFAGTVHATDADGGAARLAAMRIELPRAIDDPRALAGGARLAAVAEHVFAPLAAAHPGVRFRLDGSRVAGLGYYDGLTLQIWATDRTGASLPLGDGGFTRWTRTLLGDRKERLCTSGLGLELVPKRYRR